MDLRWWLRFLTGFAVLYGVLAGLAAFDATGRFGLVILGGVLGAAVTVEWVLDRTRPAEAVRTLGLGRPGERDEYGRDRIEYRAGRAEELPLDDASAGGALISNVIHHIDDHLGSIRKTVGH